MGKADVRRPCLVLCHDHRLQGPGCGSAPDLRGALVPVQLEVADVLSGRIGPREHQRELGATCRYGERRCCCVVVDLRRAAGSAAQRRGQRSWSVGPFPVAARVVSDAREQHCARVLTQDLVDGLCVRAVRRHDILTGEKDVIDQNGGAGGDQFRSTRQVFDERGRPAEGEVGPWSHGVNLLQQSRPFISDRRGGLARRSQDLHGRKLTAPLDHGDAAHAGRLNADGDACPVGMRLRHELIGVHDRDAVAIDARSSLGLLGTQRRGGTDARGQ